MVAWMVAAVSAVALPATATDIVALDSTGLQADARGKATLTAVDVANPRFSVRVQRLAADTDYDLVVGGTSVYTLRTSANGKAKVRFAGESRSERIIALGFEPWGKEIEVTTTAGDAVLAAALPGEDTTLVACCVPVADATQCEERTASDCGAAAGSIADAGSCTPDLCPGPPPAPSVCCIADASGASFVCEDIADADCTAAGGVSKGEGICAADSCVEAPPPDPTCADNCWASFFACLDGCTSTYCAPFCQVDLGRCLDACPQ